MNENPMTNQKVLTEQQYKHGDNLSSRAQLHELFTVAKEKWFTFVSRHLNLQENEEILELGSGTGLLWQANNNQIPENCHITLTDLSDGMLDSIKNNLSDIRFTMKQMDAQEITFPDNSFDTVIANHMLYHLPDISKGLQEINRVLKPDGKLIAATNGMKHLTGLYNLLSEFDSNVDIQRQTLTFNLDNGEEILQKHFEDIECHRYESYLRITDIKPLLAYYRSMQTMGIDFDQFDQEKYAAFLQSILDQDGHILIQKDQGLFIASN